MKPSILDESSDDSFDEISRPEKRGKRSQNEDLTFGNTLNLKNTKTQYSKTLNEILKELFI